MVGVIADTGTKTLAAEVAQLVMGTSLADLPPEFLEKVKIHVLDQISCQLVPRF